MSEKPQKKYRRLSAKKIAELYSALSSVIVAKPELNFRSSFELLIAVLLSAQCTDKCVNKVTEQLWQKVHSPQDMLDMGIDALKDAIHSIGFYNMKAQHIIELCKILQERHGGEVPGTFEELTALPGVGVKTANVVLNLWFGLPTIPVDTHVFRVAHRCGLSNAATPEATELDLEKKTPAEYKKDAHHLLLLHGRYTCKAIAPKCESCPIATICVKNGL